MGQRMRLGIGTYTYTWAIGVPGHEPAQRMGALDLIDRASRFGAEVVQICDNLPLAGFSDSDLDRLAARAEELGIAIVGYARGSRLSVYSHPERLGRAE